MTVAYRVYSNHGTGGPVDFNAPVAVTRGLAYTTGPLGLATDTTFVVRAYDTATGLEEANTDARVRIVLGADGTDLTGLPGAPHAVTLAPASGGGARLGWAYAAAGAPGRPTGFQVYLTGGSAAVGSSPAATVPYVEGKLGYSCLLPGPFTLSTYTATVRSYNATGVGAGGTPVSAVLGTPTPFTMEPVLADGGVQNS